MPPRMLFNNPFATHGVEEFLDDPAPLDLEKRIKVSNTSGTDSDASSSLSAPDVLRSAECLRVEIEEDLATEEHDTAYDKKSKIINKAIQDIGMGRYQWMLFILCGFGWFADNIWLQSVALTLPSLSTEFGIDENTIRYTSLSLFLGLCIGASFWGVVSDIVGRRPAFNTTLFLAGASGLSAYFAPTWIGVCALYACIGLGIGGNLPIDGALFLEFLPFASSNLLTLLSVWWPAGQLFASLVAWAFIPNFAPDKGWRYLILTMGALTVAMFICRCLIFHLLESPKFLLSRGRQREAVAVVHGIAYFNTKTSWLTEDILNTIGGHPNEAVDDQLTTRQIVRRSLGKFSAERIGPLFNGKKTIISTCLVWFIWTTIGMGYPLFNAFLPQYLAQNGAGGASPHADRDYAITSVVGVPGSILACYTVNIPYIGRRGTMAFATLMSGIFIVLFTTATTPGFQLAMSCMEAFFQNIMYGVLYAYTPELFPAPNRGTATGISSFLNRFAGLCAPLVAVNAGIVDPKAPIYASAGLFFVAFLAMLALPFETSGRQSL